MKNNNDKLMKNYFNSMLCDEVEAVSDKKNNPIDKPDFFENKAIVNEVPQVSRAIVETVKTKLAEQPTSIVNTTLPKHLVFASPELKTEQKVELIKVEPVTSIDEWKNIDVENEFQVLFFELNEVSFAIPLTDLGGIYPLDKTLNALPGKPNWFAGVFNHSGRLYNIVDSACWLQFSNDTNNLDYTHFIALGDSPWGLSCEKLCGASVLKKEQVRWREKEGSRPWLAGMVKDKMCVLIHAQELAKLLDKGVDING